MCPYLHDLKPEELGRPLEQFNGVSTSKEGTYSLVRSIDTSLGDAAHMETLEAIFEFNWPALEAAISAVPKLDSDTSLKVSHLQQELPRLISAIRDRPEFIANGYLAHVICDVLLRLKRNLEHPGPHFDVPITLYPAHLVSLLEGHQPGIEVRAIAIVDATEHFWPQREGERILKATPVNSTRVFVFHEREHMKANVGWLARHSKKYNVYVASFKRLASLGADYVKDFSIIGGTSQPLLAYYVDSVAVNESGLPLKMIRFSTDKGELSEHQDVYANMARLATHVASSDAGKLSGVLSAGSTVVLNPDDEESVERLADSAFDRTSRSFERKQVEMSSYIDVLEYDLHEEEHAYYCDMMEQMLTFSGLRERVEDVPQRVLEFGAGTGLFTKRLARLAPLDITSVELDWACYHLLRVRMEAVREEMQKLGSKFKAENKDCRTFNPEGHFQLIFSCFADHHIYLSDKPRYFANVARNLTESGLYIVGDEFLPEHDEHSAADRVCALRAYHGHIIDVANAEGLSNLAQLEENALQSGLQSVGDFKVSCSVYERLAGESGLDLQEKVKIGPLDREDVGGVYVYVFK